MNERASISGDRLPLLITIGIFVLMLLCVPIVLNLDGDLDQDRPMYEDLQLMLNYQAAHIANEGRPVEATVSDGESIKVGANEFTASPGVTVVVRATDKDSFCVSASNGQGVKSPEHCSE